MARDDDHDSVSSASSEPSLLDDCRPSKEWLAEHIEEAFATSQPLNHYEVHCIIRHLEYRDYDDFHIQQGEMTAPALYVVIKGGVRLTQKISNTFREEVSTPVAFGQQLLEQAEFRKTAAGKLLESLVKSPYT